MLVSMLLLGLLACGGGETTPSPASGGNATEAKAKDKESKGRACKKCLKKGGTWQPEANQCTEDCDIMDISCYRDGCPADCAVDNCGDCFRKDQCEKAGCTWNQQHEISWCN